MPIRELERQCDYAQIPLLQLPGDVRDDSATNPCAGKFRGSRHSGIWALRSFPTRAVRRPSLWRWTEVDRDENVVEQTSITIYNSPTDRLGNAGRMNDGR